MEVTTSFGLLKTTDTDNAKLKAKLGAILPLKIMDPTTKPDLLLDKTSMLQDRSLN